MSGRVWIFNHYATPRDVGSGTRHVDLGAELGRRGWDVTIFASSFDHFTGRDARLNGRQLWAAERHGGVRFVWVRTTPYAGNGAGRLVNMASFAVAAGIAQGARRQWPDVVVGSSVHPLAAWTAERVATRLRVPFVFEIRDLWPQTLVDMGALAPGGVTARLLYRLERRLCDRAAKVVVLLPGARDYLRGRGVDPAKVVHVPNGVVLSARTGSSPAPATEALVRSVRDLRRRGALVAGYAGSHGAANRVDVLVEAARALRGRNRDIHLVLIGDGPQKARCVAAARQHGLSNVSFAPPVPKHDVHTVLRALDAHVFHLADLPVFAYGLSSNKLFDYMAAGRPIVFAAGVEDNPVARAGAGLQVRPEDPEALADALVALQGMSPGERARLGERGRRYVAAEHSVGALAGRFAAVLEDARGRS